MKRITISPRSVEFSIGILATTMIALGLLLYMWQEPVRIAEAQADQLSTELDEAMSLYAENCSVCHGLAGEGIGATPPLNNPALQKTDSNALEKIIARGLYGTSMPAWSKEDGGPLSDYQISELVSLIQYGDWQAVQDRGVNMGVAPLIPFTAEPDSAVLENLVALPGGEILARGVTLYAEECVACHGADGLGSSLAPALNDTAVREKSADELERIVLNGVSGTLMAPWQNKLLDEEVAALVALMTQWDQVPSGAIPAPDNPLPVTEESLALGVDLYRTTCTNCHGPEGQGTRRAPALNVKGFLADTPDAAIQQIITQGVPGTSMPAWGDRLVEAEIQAIVGFIRSWEPTAPEVAEPARGGGPPWWQSGSSQAPGGQIGGPPWMRSNNSASANTASLPSGGGLQTSSVQATQASDAGTKVDPTQVAQAHTTTQEGPPWARQTQSTSWWQQVDWRVWSFVVAGSLAALILIVIALVGLRRMDSAAN